MDIKTQNILNALDENRSNPTVENYNAVRSELQDLALRMLIEKATQGSTMAIIELSKAAKYLPTNIKDTATLAAVEGLSLEDLKSYIERVELVEREDGKVKLDPQAVLKAYEEGRLSSHKATKYLNMLQKAKNAEGNSFVGGDWSIWVNKESIDAISGD